MRMSDTTSKRPLSRAQHLAGTGMLLLALLLVAATAVSSWQAVRATRAPAEPRTEVDESRP